MAGFYNVGQNINRKSLVNSCSKLPSIVKKRLFMTCLCWHDESDNRVFMKGKHYEYGNDDRLLLATRKRVIRTPSRHFFQIPENLMSNKRREYSHRKLIGFSMENLYHVVSHVEDYKHFVPWCRDSVVFDQKTGHAKCKLEIGFPPVVERYISVLTLVPPNLVVSECTQGELFNYMKTVWRFSPGLKGNPKTSIVDFKVAFEFRSVLHSQLSSLFFDEVVKKMVGTFEKRCEHVYGPSSLTRSQQRHRTRTKRNNTAGTVPR